MQWNIGICATVKTCSFCSENISSAYCGITVGLLFTASNTVELGFKNHQNKNLLEFKNQISNHQLLIYVINYNHDKDIFDFRNQNGSDRKIS